jgi:hypothetical protein
MRRIAPVLSALILISAPAWADDTAIGFVKTLAGTATVTHDGDGPKPAVLAMPIHATDRVETGQDGQLGITFRDDTRIALGPNSRLDVPRFVFKPAEQTYGFVLRLAYGTLQYISGLTAKLFPDAMVIETPVSTLAVRGTRLLVRVEK